MIFLQPLYLLYLQECTVPHLKDLIHIYLEPEAQGSGTTSNSFLLGQSTPISYHTDANGCIFLAAGVGNDGCLFISR